MALVLFMLELGDCACILDTSMLKCYFDCDKKRFYSITFMASTTSPCHRHQQ